MLDLAFFAAAVSWGLDVAMIDARTPLLPWMTRGLDFLMGTDPYAKAYLAYHRTTRACKKPADNAPELH
jgi:hypothetical protein